MDAQTAIKILHTLRRPCYASLLNLDVSVRTSLGRTAAAFADVFAIATGLVSLCLHTEADQFDYQQPERTKWTLPAL